MKLMELNASLSVTQDKILQLEIMAWVIQAEYLGGEKEKPPTGGHLENLEEVKSSSLEVFRVQLYKTRVGPMAIIQPQKGCWTTCHIQPPSL